MTNNKKIALILGLLFISIILVFTLDPIAQDISYHNFSDQRSLLSINNFGDVASNIPYIIVGFIGLIVTLRSQNNREKFQNHFEIIPFIVAFSGIILVGFGSAYYHLNPTNQTLVWDRIPMTIGFAAIFSVIIGERINLKLGLFLLPILLIIGLFSIYYWNLTEQSGVGDLRSYALVQFFPILAIPIIIALFKAKYSGSRYLGEVVAWYLIAKILEHFDSEIFELTNQIVSGHTLKHLASAFATYGLVRYIKFRRLVK
ncbi:MAG: hypothetical protein ACJAZX_001578 [Rickettsiales bacterium]|jgi:hypothetical protein